MRLFGRKKEAIDDPLFKSATEPLGPPDALGLPNDGFRDSGMLEHTEPRSTFAPMQVPQSTQPASFAPAQQNLERELQLINSKLDTLKAQLDALALRLGEKKDNEIPPRRAW